MFDDVDIMVDLQTGTTSVLLRNEERTEIEAVRQAIKQGGASDGESEQLDRILADLLAKKINPAEAIKAAHAVSESRQDYH